MSNLRDFHEYTNIFPMMETDELDKLTDDISKNGQIEPVWLYEGKIIDGRNRYIACLNAGVEPRFQDWAGEGGTILDFVVSKNLFRRHLNASQKAMAAAKAKDLENKLSEDAYQRKVAGGKAGLNAVTRGESGKFEAIDGVVARLPQAGDGIKSRDIIAELFDTSPRYVQDAKEILKKAPDLADLVEQGKMTIPKARKEVIRREEATTLERAVTRETGCYDIIYADLPNGTNYERLEEIGYHIRDVLAHEKTMLFFWCPAANLTDVLSILIHNWQFTYRNCFVWDMVNPIKGKYFNARHELLLILSKGAAVFPTNPAQFDSIQRIETEGHKRPEEFLRILQQLYENFSIIRLEDIIGNIPSVYQEVEPESIQEAENQVDLELKAYLDKYADL